MVVEAKVSLQTLIIGISLIIQVGIKISSVHKRLASEKRENPVKKVMLASRSETSGKEAFFEEGKCPNLTYIMRAGEMGSMVKSTCCFLRDPGFSSQRPHRS